MDREIEIGGLICQVDLFRVTIPQGVGETHPHPIDTHLPSMSSGVLPSSLEHASPIVQSSPSDPQGSSPQLPPSATRSSQPGSFAYPVPSYYDANTTASPVSPVTPPGSSAGPPGGPNYTFPDIPPINTFTEPGSMPGYMQQQPLMSTYGYNNRRPARQMPRPPPGARQPPPSIDVDSLPPPTEGDKLTRCLFGEYYSHAASILDLQGKAVIYFVFSDLSVKLEGLFRPRYRFFDLFSRTEYCDDVPVLAECFGGAFAVYSTKEFPGLKASTELTKHLNRWGIRVNIRETERKRRPRASERESGGTAAGSGGERDSLGASGVAAAGVGMSMGLGAGSSAGRRRRGSGSEEGGEGHGMLDAPRRYLNGAAAARERRERERERGESRSERGAGSASSRRRAARS